MSADMLVPDLGEMQEKDIRPVCELIARAMNDTEADWAKRTFEYHFSCHANGLDDGRQYYTCHTQTALLAICGLHHYAWGPGENVWLAWFAVQPEYQRRGLGRQLLALLEQRARARGYRKLFIETYDHPDFARARAFYAACGFERAGEIAGYLPGDESMYIYRKVLDQADSAR